MRLTEEIRDRRVAVARDVLLQMGREDTPLRMGTSFGYISGYMPTAAVDLAGDLQDQADAVQVVCGVCAMGALLLSKARLTDAVPMADVVNPVQSIKYAPDKTSLYIGRDDVCRLLEDTFDGDTLDRVEAFFEGKPTSMDPEDYYLEGISAYVDAMPDFRDRMAEIAENIVRNRGEFVVPAEYAEAGPASHKEWHSMRYDDDDE